MRVTIEISEGREVYVFKLLSGIINENSSVALVNMKGRVLIKNPSEGGRVYLEFPFEIPEIMPFDTALLDIDKKTGEKDAVKVLDLLKIDRGRLLQGREIDSIFIDDKFIRFEITSCDKKNIGQLLKGKGK